MGYMVVFLELLFLVLSISFLWFLAKSSPARLSKSLLVYLIVLLLGGISFYFLSFVFSFLVKNVLLQLFFTFLAVLGVCIWGLLTLRPKLQEKEVGYAFFERYCFLVKCSVMVFFLSLSLSLYISVLAILSADEALFSKIRKEGVLSSLLMPNENDKTDQPWESLKSGIARSTGSRDIAENIRALNFILSLDTEEYPQLIKENGSLKDVVNSQALQDIVTDTELLSTFLEGDLSLGQVYRLAENKKVKALLDDEDFLKKVRRLDLLQLEKDIINLRTARYRVLSPEWSTSSIDSSLHLDECLKSGDWELCNADSVSLPVGKFSLIKSKFPESGKVSFKCKASVPPVVLHGDMSYSMESHGDIYILDLDINREQDVIFLFNFPEGKSRLCSIETFIK